MFDPYIAEGLRFAASLVVAVLLVMLAIGMVLGNASYHAFVTTYPLFRFEPLFLLLLCTLQRSTKATDTKTG